MDAQDVFDFIHEVEGVAAEVVDFIDEGEDGNAPFFTDAEKFLCLGFDAFGDVDEHDGAVGSHEGPVRIFTEVLMARRVENIDMMTFVVELKDRTGDRDTTLFSISIQSETACFAVFLALTEPARWIAPP